MSVRGVSSAILERESELELVRSAVAAAESGDGVVLVVRGPAGIGKTRLLSEARAIAAKREVLVLFARGGEVERDLPWGAVRQLLDPVLRGLSGAARASDCLLTRAGLRHRSSVGRLPPRRRPGPPQGWCTACTGCWSG